MRNALLVQARALFTRWPPACCHVRIGIWCGMTLQSRPIVIATASAAQRQRRSTFGSEAALPPLLLLPNPTPTSHSALCCTVRACTCYDVAWVPEAALW